MKRRVLISLLASTALARLNESFASAQDLSNWSNEELIGQMLCFGIRSTALDAQETELLKRTHCGNVILFKRNCKSADQLRLLTQEIRSLTGIRMPPILAIDEEGGKVSRLPSEFRTAPTAKSIGDTGDTTQAEHWARISAQSILLAGLNTNLAPLLEPHHSHERSYSDDIRTLTRYAMVAAKAHYDTGTIFVLKHFPGFSALAKDTHHDVARVECTFEELFKGNAQAFETVFKRFPHDRFMVMAGHVAFPQISPLPACLSPELMSGLLRDKLGFQGVVLTDDIEMPGVAKFGGAGGNAVKAILAGCDMVLVCHQRTIQAEVFDAIAHAVKDGTITRERLVRSVRRIIALKRHIHGYSR